jgi:hypothetical protein
MLKIEVPENAEGMVVLPTEYKDANIEITNLKNGKKENLKTENGKFNIRDGSFSIKIL